MYGHLGDILTVKDVSDFLCIGRNTTYDLVSSGELKSIRIKNQIRVLKSDLIEYVENSRNNTT